MNAPISSLEPQPTLANFRFGVFFFTAGAVPNPLDIRFQRVKGLTSTVTTTPITEGGQNLYTQQVPSRVSYGNLVLERGLWIGSPLHLEFETTLSLFKFGPSNVLVTLFSSSFVPLAAWSFFRAYPVKWSVSDLDASSTTGLLIDSLELSYSRMQIMRI